MTTLSTGILRLSARALPAAAALVLALSAGNASPSLSEDTQVAATAAKKQVASIFGDEDAPYGVDPIVTGPVSETFRQRREAADCDRAEWPHVPSVCYPD